VTGISIENDKKPWNRDRLFQRVNSPSFAPANSAPPFPEGSIARDGVTGALRLTGDGHAQGTRRPADFDAGSGIDLIRRQLIRTVPAWVKTAHPSDDLQTNERTAEQEIYGQLKRSFQTWTDAPPFQWHRWYDWNFHIEAAKEFDWLRGAGNIKGEPDPDEKPSENQRKFPMVDAVRGDVMECEWDVGAFGPKPGPMFNDRDRGQTSVDWVWPMAGDFVWLVGRSIYDGGHEDTQKLCRSELHPCKAMATARREAFAFPAVGHAVAATQFSFFASVHGGVVDFKTLKPKDGKNYEFLVDLPVRPHAFQPLQHPVGATSDFPFNRIALRHVEPIFHLDFSRHTTAFGKHLTAEQLRATPPEITFERPKDEADETKWQARIKIPIVDLIKKHGEFDTYGVVISLGWPDPTGDEGRKVKKVQVNFRDLLPHAFKPNSQIWRFKVGVNGRWFHWEREDVMKVTFIHKPKGPPEIVVRPVPIPLSMDTPLTLFLHEDDVVRVSTHGAILGPVDGVHTGRTPSGTLGGNILGGFGTDDARTVKISPVQVAIEGGVSALDIFPDENFGDQNLLMKIITILESIALAPLDLVLLLLGLLGLNPRQLAAIGTLRPVEWNRDVDVRPFAETGTHAVQRVVVKNQADMMVFTLGDENDPLALVDGDIGPGPDDKLAPPGMAGKNPMPVKDRNDPEPSSPPGAPSVVLKGLVTESNEALAELLEHRQVDNPPLSTTAKRGENRDPVMYEFGYDVIVQDQKLQSASV